MDSRSECGSPTDCGIPAGIAHVVPNLLAPSLCIHPTHGYDWGQSQDLTQGFFARLIEKKYPVDADRRRGRFRSFLLAAVTHFLANERDRAQALKWGRAMFQSLSISWKRRIGMRRPQWGNQ